jgi:esterase
MKLFYRKYGNGPPLIILHGLYGSSDNWVTIAKKLEGCFTVYLPDQRNHGRSPHHDIHTYDALKEDIHELATDLNLKKFFLAGHSMGGKTAIAFALKWPELLNGLLVADISPFDNETASDPGYSQNIAILRTIISFDPAGIRSRKDAELILSERIASDKIRGIILKNLQRSDDETFEWKINASALLNNLTGIMKGFDRENLISQHITGFPVLFLKGEYSAYLPESDYSDIRKAFPSAEFAVIPGAGHWIHADRPDEVVINLKRLLEGV